jgi:ABC-2 type transport system permease protein
MNKTLAVVKREYLGHVKSKGFLIGTLLAPIVMTAMILVPGLLVTMSTGEQWRISVVDRSGLIYPPLQATLDDTLKNGQPTYILQEIPASMGQWEQTRETLAQQVTDKSISAFLVLEPDILSTGQAELYAGNVGDFTTLERIESVLGQIVVEMKLKAEGLDPERIHDLTRGVHMRTLKVDKAGQQESGFGQLYRNTFVFIFILYMTILLYGVTVMRGVIEEKSSRIVEILLSSIKPAQLMAGKIIGVGCVGLTQYLIWVAFGLILTTIGAAYLGLADAISAIPPITFLYFVLFYLLGYFLYATLYAGIGAICTTEQEAQQTQFPIIALLIIPLLMMTMIIKNPDGTISTVLSMIPFFSPTLMFLRVNVASPPQGQILGSIALLSITIVAMIWVVARIFRVGILMYGKKPSLPEVVRWVKTR